jgi:hypothetical protein
MVESTDFGQGKAATTPCPPEIAASRPYLLSALHASTHGRSSDNGWSITGFEGFDPCSNATEHRTQHQQGDDDKEEEDDDDSVDDVMFAMDDIE